MGKESNRAKLVLISSDWKRDGALTFVILSPFSSPLLRLCFGFQPLGEFASALSREKIYETKGTMKARASKKWRRQFGICGLILRSYTQIYFHILNHYRRKTGPIKTSSNAFSYPLGQRHDSLELRILSNINLELRNSFDNRSKCTNLSSVFFNRNFVVVANFQP